MAWSLYHVTLTFVLLLIWLRRHSSRVPYPPGPPAEPVLGHLRLMPSKDQEVVFREWSKIYGDMIYLHVPGRSYLVLNSLRVATELLDKRSGIYSDRMRTVLYELMGWFPTLAILPYGKKFQKHRRLMQEYLHQKQCLSYQPFQTQQARRLAIQLTDNPHNFMNHFQRFATSLIVKVAYGRDIISDEDPYIGISAEALHGLIACGSVGMRFLPSWFPGTYYAFMARSYRPAVRIMHEYPFEAVKQELKEGTAQPSFLSHYLSQLHGDYNDEEHIDDLKGSACMMLQTFSALSFFTLAMVLFPEVQKKAQEEIDEVLGKGRMPEFSDRSSLPYVEAVMQEVLRWNTIVPSGVPHSSIENDVYEGMFIPKGTVLIPNAFAILRDESIYTDPDTFNPSRYLPKPEGNAEPYPIGHFGFGRRICPGQYFAESSLWIAVSSILATLNIRRSLDENGKEIVPKVELLTGLTSHPKPFFCYIQPRDQTSESMIRQAQIWDDD
ncbi:cytochrome P450 [Cyathus striatus]|nr:cytochrome P450 [Cyathus striatus]